MGHWQKKKWWKGVGETERKKRAVHVYFKHLLQNHFPGLDETSGTSSGGAWLSCQRWGKRKIELGPVTDVQSSPRTLTYRYNKIIHLSTFLFPFLSVKGFYCSLFCTTILLFYPSDIKLSDCLRARHSQRQERWEECTGTRKVVS